MANRLATVTDWNSNQTAYAYDDANRMTTATLPNGVVSTSSYDNANHLTGITHVKGLTTLASVSYTVDAVGNRSDRTDAAGTQAYAYDNLYRLTSVTYPGPTTTSYGYDAFGNRTSMTVAGATTNYSYDDASRLATVTPPSPAPATSYTWHNNGDLTARGSDSFGWDYEDRMTSATVGGTSYTYAYRGDGLRNSATTGGVTKTFTWDLNAGLPVVLDDGARYVYGNGLIAQVAGANTYYYLSDGLGSTLKTTDASGNVVNSYTYDVYGKTTSSSGSQANDVQFAGQQTDPTGLQYLRARYYDPETGGFLSRDPLSTMPSWSGSPFGYAGANPASRVDPTGLRFCGSDPDDCDTNPRLPQRTSVPGPSCPTATGECPTGYFYCATAPGGMARDGACRPLDPDAASGLSIRSILGHICVVAGLCAGGGTFLINGVQFWDGLAGQKAAFKKYSKMGQNEYESGNKLHRLKDDWGISAKANLAFDEKGNVYQEVVDTQSGQRYLQDLGNILDDTYGSGRK